MTFKTSDIKILFGPQELRNREEELRRDKLRQTLRDQELQQKEKELKLREIELVKRELSITLMMQEQQTPTPNRRRGHPRSQRLYNQIKKELGLNIGPPRGSIVLQCSLLKKWNGHRTLGSAFVRKNLRTRSPVFFPNLFNQLRVHLKILLKKKSY